MGNKDKLNIYHMPTSGHFNERCYRENYIMFFLRFSPDFQAMQRRTHASPHFRGVPSLHTHYHNTLFIDDSLFNRQYREDYRATQSTGSTGNTLPISGNSDCSITKETAFRGSVTTTLLHMLRSDKIKLYCALCKLLCV